MTANRIDNVKEKAQETMHNAGQTVQEAKGAARDVASNLGQQARETATAVADRARDYAKEAGHRTDEAISSVGQGFSSLAGNIRQNAPREGYLHSAASNVADQLDASGRYLQQHGVAEIGNDLANCVRSYPIPSLLAVFGFGFVLGSALRR